MELRWRGSKLVTRKKTSDFIILLRNYHVHTSRREFICAAASRCRRRRRHCRRHRYWVCLFFDSRHRAVSSAINPQRSSREKRRYKYERWFEGSSVVTGKIRKHSRLFFIDALLCLTVRSRCEHFLAFAFTYTHTHTHTYTYTQFVLK